MSYPIDRSRAVSLQQRDGVWSLEVESLVRITRNTFRPKRQKVAGAEAIMQHLLVHHGTLIGATKQVLEGAAGQLESRFELRQGGWIPVPATEDVDMTPVSADGGHGGQPSGPAVTDPAVITEVASLRKRVEHLERTMALLAEEVANGAGVGTSIDDTDGLMEAATAGEPGAEAAAEAAEVPPEPAEPEPDFAALKMPPVEAVVDLVKGLVGDEAGMSVADSSEWDLTDSPKGFLAPLNSDGGEPIGALIMDMEGTIRLAGGMLMEPTDELDAQVQDGSPSDDILDAAGEVLNTLTSSINKVSGNAHVRCGALEPLPAEAYSWLGNPRVRQDLCCSIGGRVVIVGR